MEAIKDMSGVISEGNTTVKGENIAFRDQNIYITDSKELGGIQFRKITSTPEKNVILPIVENDVLNSLLNNRVIIVNASNSVDMIDFQDAVIQQLQKKVHHDLFELIGDQNDQSILPELLKEKSNRIIILNDLDPMHFNYDLSELLGIATRKNSFFFITTKSEKNRWEKSGSQLNDLWVELDPEKMYDPVQIRAYFYKGLAKSEVLTIPENIHDDIILAEEITASNVLQKINRPLQLTLFIDRFNRLSERPSDAELQKLLDQVVGKSDEIIERWFSQLSHPQKLIAIAFALFDGALASQFFEGLERLLSNNSIWKISAPELAAIDFKDIEFLSPFIHKEQGNSQERMISSKPDYKRVVFKTLWQTHRRHLLSIFPNLIDILAETYKRRTTNWELFGTTERRSIIRQSFVEAISDLGTVNIDAAENVLLDLAANGHYFVKSLVAKSLAKWRGLNKDEQLFKLLSRWQNDTVIVELVKEKLSRRENTISNSRINDTIAIEHVKSTVAITLSRAAEYDQRNKLDARLVELYGEIAKDASPSVQDTISKSLPQFIHKHIEQLSSLIFEDLMKYGYYSEAISLGLFKAFEEDPQAIKTLLDQWLESCLDTVSDENRRKKTTYRDNILTTIMCCIQEIYQDAELRKHYSNHEIYELLLRLLSSEGRQAVREKALFLLGAVVKTSFPDAINYISKVKKVLKKNEQKAFVDDLTSEYILQRSLLKGGDTNWIFSEDIKIPVWMTRLDRPITSIELEMFEWINHNNSVAKEFATLLFLNISLIVEEREINFINQENKRRAERRQQLMAKKDQIMKPIQPPNNIGIGLWVKVRIFLMLLFESSENKRTLQDLLKFLLNVRGYKLIHIRMMNRKWEKFDPNRLGGKLGRWLDKLV